MTNSIRGHKVSGEALPALLVTLAGDEDRLSSPLKDTLLEVLPEPLGSFGEIGTSDGLRAAGGTKCRAGFVSPVAAVTLFVEVLPGFAVFGLNFGLSCTW